tara:strand:+ start:654 stop:815 length:162 start_codon:yes stop_codon:yes gene_type:complete
MFKVLKVLYIYNLIVPLISVNYFSIKALDIFLLLALSSKYISYLEPFLAKEYV